MFKDYLFIRVRKFDNSPAITARGFFLHRMMPFKSKLFTWAYSLSRRVKAICPTAKYYRYLLEIGLVFAF